MRFASDRSNSNLNDDFYLNNVKENKGLLLNNVGVVVSNYIAPSNNYIVYTPDVTTFNGSEYTVFHNISSLCARLYDTNIFIEDGFVNGDMLKCLEHCAVVYPYKYSSYFLSLSDVEFKNFIFKEKLGYKEATNWLSDKVIQAIEYKASKGY